MANHGPAVNGPLLGTARYRLRTTFSRRWTGYLTIVLLVGLIGGLAMGSIAGARRTGSSYATYLASTDPSDLTVTLGVDSCPTCSGYSPTVERTLARLPHVERVEGSVETYGQVLEPDGTAPTINATMFNEVDPIASTDGLYFDQDRVTPVAGRMADPARVDEMVMSPAAASLQGLHVGETVPVGFYTNAQSVSPLFGTPALRPATTVRMTLVGLVVFHAALIQDQVDRYPTDELFTPALAKKIGASGAGVGLYGLRLRGGAAEVAAVEGEIFKAFPAGGYIQFHVTATSASQAARALKPEAIALGVFGAIAAVAALLIAGQAIGRQLRLGVEDEAIVRALGASPAMTVMDGLAGIGMAIVAGSLLAVVVAVALSPLAPLGPVHAVYPSPGVSFDWVVLGGGLAVSILGLGAVALVLAILAAPHRLSPRRLGSGARPSRLATSAASSGLPLSAATGIRFALQPGTGRNAVPVRSAIVGAALAVLVLTTTVTFGASLDSLVSHPALYGWNWDYALESTNGEGATLPETQTLLDDDRDVASSAGVDFRTVDLDGQTVAALQGTAHAAFGPPVLSGHAVDGSGQIVLGQVTLAQLHKRIGDTVHAVTEGGSANFTIVGTTTLPAVGISQGLHTSMGTGAYAALGRLSNNAPEGCNGPTMIFVRLRPGVGAAQGRASLERIADRTNRAFDAFGPTSACAGEFVSVVGAQRPAEIVNYQSMGDTPAILAAGLAAGAVAALGLTLTASVRRRRRDLALFKTLGFVRRQLMAALSWQSTVAVGIGTLVGVPLGIIGGRLLWNLFARSIDVVPAPSVPAQVIALIVIGALVLANLVAAVPGRLAARTPTALLLRAE
jgi:hypothetical protein